MRIESLKVLYDNVIESGLDETKLENFLKTFNCEKNYDVEDFLKNKAIRFHKSGLARTYLIINDNEEIVAYFTIAFKPIFYNNQIHKVSKSKYKKLNAREYTLRQNKKITVINSILIAQIGRNDIFSKNDISLNEIISSIFEIVEQVRDLIGTRIVLIEVNNEPKLIELYESLGFEYIGVQDDLTQLYKLDLK